MKLSIRFATLAVLAGGLVSGLATPAHAEQLSPDELLARYQPLLVLDRFERFAPAAVDGFLADSVLQQRGDDGTYHDVDLPPAGLPVHGDGWRLDQRGCSPDGGLAAVACYDAAGDGPSVTYGRFEVRGGTIVLQYWVFYDFNFWSLQYPPSNLVWQAHEGDWEVVTLVLDEEQLPVEAAYSQHCTGQRRPWANVPKLGDHPIAYVASGSHANLFSPGARPIARSCIPQPALDLLDQSGLTAFDVVAPATPPSTFGPGTTAVERIHDNGPRWVRFPGTFGETQWIHSPLGNLVAGAGPESPQQHDVWIDPLATIEGWSTR